MEAEICGFQPDLISYFPWDELPGGTFPHDWQVVSCAATASFLASSRVIMRFSRAGRNVFPMDGYALGSDPSMRENGEVLVE